MAWRGCGRWPPRRGPIQSGRASGATARPPNVPSTISDSPAGASEEFSELQQVGEARLDRDPARCPRAGEVQLAGDQRQQVVAADREPDLRPGVVAVGEVHDPTALEAA